MTVCILACDIWPVDAIRVARLSLHTRDWSTDPGRGGEATRDLIS